MKKIRSWSSFVHCCVHELRKGSKRKQTKKNVEMCSESNVMSSVMSSHVNQMIKVTLFTNFGSHSVFFPFLGLLGPAVSARLTAPLRASAGPHRCWYRLLLCCRLNWFCWGKCFQSCLTGADVDAWRWPSGLTFPSTASAGRACLYLQEHYTTNETHLSQLDFHQHRNILRGN